MAQNHRSLSLMMASPLTLVHSIKASTGSPIDWNLLAIFHFAVTFLKSHAYIITRFTSAKNKIPHNFKLSWSTKYLIVDVRSHIKVFLIALGERQKHTLLFNLLVPSYSSKPV